MSWTNVGSWATASSTTGGTTLVVNRPGTTTAVGNVLVLIVSSDNITTTTGASNDHSSITDNSGNTWVKVQEYTVSSGSAADGATCSVWYLPITTQVASGGSITINFGSSVTAKAASIRNLSTAGDASRVGVAQTPQTTSILASDAPAQTISGLTSAEYIFIRAIASETLTSGMSTTTNYTAFGSLAASTGTTGTSVSVAGETRILTATGDTSDPGHGPADQVGIYFALAEILVVADGVRTGSLSAMGCGR